MPALILLLWVISRSTTLRRHGPTVLWLLIICLAVRQTWSRQHRQHGIAVLPLPEPMPFSQNRTTKNSPGWHNTHNPEIPSFNPSWLNFYPPLELHSPTYIDGLWPSESRPQSTSHYQCGSWNRNRSSTSSGPTDGQTRQDIPHPEQDYLGPFRAYLTSHYTRVHVFSTQDEVWQRS